MSSRSLPHWSSFTAGGIPNLLMWVNSESKSEPQHKYRLQHHRHAPHRSYRKDHKDNYRYKKNKDSKTGKTSKHDKHDKHHKDTKHDKHDTKHDKYDTKHDKKDRKKKVPRDDYYEEPNFHDHHDQHNQHNQHKQHIDQPTNNDVVKYDNAHRNSIETDMHGMPRVVDDTDFRKDYHARRSGHPDINKIKRVRCKRCNRIHHRNFECNLK